MKRRADIIPLAADPDNLRRAFLKARRGKTYSREVLRFQDQLDENLGEILGALVSGQLGHSGYRKFIIYEPKRREICAGSFRDNVLHHALLNVCHVDFERHQIFDSYACRIGKGTHAGVERAQVFCRRYKWYLKLDVRNFFASVHHDVIQGQLDRFYKDPILLRLFAQILATYADTLKRGLPLGNLTSQYFANHYLTPVDKLIKQKLRLPAYVRYMDDMVLWYDDKSSLLKALDLVEERVQTDLRCMLKPPVLQRCQRGLSFLGYRIFPHHLRLTHGGRKRLARKLIDVERAYHDHRLSEKDCQRRVQSLLAFAGHAETTALRRDLLRKADITIGVSP